METNSSFLKKEIMNQDRHLFIYKNDNEELTPFINGLIDDYPILLYNSNPMGIYVDDYGLPNMPAFSDSIDQDRIDIISNEFLNFSLSNEIIIKAKRNIDITYLNDRLEDFINTINDYSLNKDFPKINSIDDLLESLNNSKQFYKQYYIDYYGSGEEKKSINEVAIPFIQIDMFVEKIKDALECTSYFAIIINNKNDISKTSTKAINSLISSRINNDISMKIITDPDKWKTYYDLNGQLIENIHDYGSINLNNVVKQHKKLLKK